MIYIKNNHGLGNRLKNLASAILLSEIIDDEVSSSWSLKNVVRFESAERRKSLPKIEFHTHRLETFSNKKAIVESEKRLVVAHNGMLTAISVDAIDHQYHNIKAEYIEKYRGVFSKISFSSRINEIADRLSHQVKIDECVGVHVRSWHDDPFRYNNLFKNSDIWQLINKEESPIFLCTDHLDVEKKAKSLGKKIASLSSDGREKHISLNSSVDSISRAIIDMLLLSRCKKLIISYQSTFAETAWWLGGCQAEAVVSEPNFLAPIRKSGILEKYPDKNFSINLS